MSLDSHIALPFDRGTALLGRSVVQFFLQSTTAYDLLAESNKVIVFDVAIPIKVAFYALVEHGELSIDVCERCFPCTDSPHDAPSFVQTLHLPHCGTLNLETFRAS